MEKQNQKAVDNALFKKLEEITIKMNNDPELYQVDVVDYLELFKVELEKVQGDTMKKNERFGELLIFHARSVRHFPEILGWIPKAVMKLMEELGPTLHHYMRKKCVGSIMILRAKNILVPVSTIEFLLLQMRLEDKELRKMIYKYLLNDIRRMNSHHQNNKINQQIRAFMSGYIPKHNDKTAQKSLKLMIELYKRNVWTDNRTVNIIAESCFAPSTRIRTMACHFLLETTEDLQELPDSDDEPLINPHNLRPKKGITKQTKAKDNQLDKEKRKAARRIRKKEIQSRKQNFMPIDLIYNPQIFVEKLFNIMSGKGEKYQHKLLYMTLIARVIWRHQLILLPFYRALIKYLEPRHTDVNQVMIALAEGIHDIVPEDEIEVIVKHIIEHFVNDRCSEYTMTIGLNTLREIFKKMPSIITEQMMLYLGTYYEYRNKNVSRAAKSVINFVREHNPMLLGKKFRGNERRPKEEDEEDEENYANQRIIGANLLPNEGSIPVEMDRILDDEDFKQMRRLLKKREEERENRHLFNNDIEYNNGDKGEYEEQEEEEEDEDDSDESSEEGQEGDEDEDDDEEIEVLDDNEDQEDEDEEEGDEDESVLDWGDAEEIEVEDEGKVKSSKSKKIVKDKKKKKTNLSNKKASGQEKLVKADVESESSSEQESENENPNGFIQSNVISYYKMSKGELKAQKSVIKEDKYKYKHKPKQKGGGTNDRQKSHLKPLMMTRFKKNKIRSGEKQLKIRIKSLKSQLGKVRSGKGAAAKKIRKQ